jgi:hypothetical protein
MEDSKETGIEVKKKKKKEKLIHPEPADRRRWGEETNHHIYS